MLLEDSSLIFSKLWFDEIKIFNPNISIAADNRMLPNSFELKQNYPNPFSPSTTIRFEVPRDAVVKLKVFNILGEEVATLLNEFRKADQYEVNFDAVKLASGVYIFQLTSGDFIAAKKNVANSSSHRG
ncbi:MAG: T9SS type A sorting domain-containing protein [Ignavibacteriales bacterium]|nr:T9SS type A sorting domain-containing protein [Ignavibacteriales bacterium]